MWFKLTVLHFVIFQRLSLLRQVYWNTPKGPKRALFKPFAWFAFGNPEKYGGGTIGWTKQLLYEAPETFVCIAGFVFASIFIGMAWKRHLTHDTLNLPPYREDYVVIRPEDPLFDVVRKRKEYYACKPMTKTPGMD